MKMAIQQQNGQSKLLHNIIKVEKCPENYEKSSALLTKWEC